MNLRPYQQEAVESVFKYWVNKEGENPVIVAPTASGKSFIIAHIIIECIRQKYNAKILCLAHVKELLEQNSEELLYVNPNLDIGIYSAGLDRRDTEEQVIYAGIQSTYGKHDLFGYVDVCIVDEAHLVNSANAGMYRTFLEGLKVINPKLKVIGLTATPYRMGSGYIHEDGMFDGVSYEISVVELLEKGYLCPLTPHSTAIHADLSDVKKRGGEFILKQMQKAFDKDDLTIKAVADIIEKTLDRKSILIFAASIHHAERIKYFLNEYGEECVTIVTGSTSKDEREYIVDRMRSGKLRILVNVGVFTTGFNAPNIDCIVLLRATESPGLYVQMLGRGMRLHSSKENCLVLDYGQNVMRHGPINDIYIKPPGAAQTDQEAVRAKECPQCQMLISLSASFCEFCGYEYPITQIKHDTEAGAVELIDPSILRTGQEAWFSIIDMYTERHIKYNKPPSMKVTYVSETGREFFEWVCFEHEGYAKDKAVHWARARGIDIKDMDVSTALRTSWKRPSRILVCKDGKYTKIKKVKFNED